jgi:menaquinone-dependent protoporphyrinogen IX oxidase
MEINMKALIVYGTRYGMTKLTADTIGEELKTSYNFEITASENRLSRDLKKAVNDFDLIVAGSSIVSGFWKSGVKRFLKKYCSNNKKVAIFITAGGTLYYAKDKGLSKEEAIEKAKEKYIFPLIKKYKLTPILLGVFGGQYKKKNKVKFNNWDKDDILKWTKELAQLVVNNSAVTN